MEANKTLNLCRKRRQLVTGWLETFKERLRLGLEDHIASCPRCQGRLVRVQRTENALKLLVTQPLTPGLLQKANQSALKVLRKDLREASCAETLRSACVRPDWTSRHHRVLETLFSAAACLAVLVLLKTGIFTRMRTIEHDGRCIMRNYYAQNLDAPLVEELFGDPPHST